MLSPRQWVSLAWWCAVLTVTAALIALWIWRRHRTKSLRKRVEELETKLAVERGRRALLREQRQNYRRVLVPLALEKGTEGQRLLMQLGLDRNGEDPHYDSHLLRQLMGETGEFPAWSPTKTKDGTTVYKRKNHRPRIPVTPGVLRANRRRPRVPAHSQ